MFKSKEQITSFMIAGHVHLSKKDYGFFSNLNYICKENKPITSNQNKLFDKLLLKYKKQLSKLNIDVLNFQNQPWKVGLVESKQEFLDAKIFIKENNIIIKAPFNNKFIENFRRIELNSFVWHKENKYYAAPLSTYNLKIAITNVNKYYADVKYCDETVKLMNQVREYQQIKYWEPTLVKSNSNFYIFGINEHLYNAIKDIGLSDDAKTLFQLSQYGIKIDSSVTNQNTLLEFASNYDVKIDLEEIELFCKILHTLEVDHVFTAREIVYNKSISNEIKLLLLQYGISCSPISYTVPSKRAVLLKISSGGYHNTNNIFKVITLTNSRPITIT